jgi:hypothetical protein
MQHSTLLKSKTAVSVQNCTLANLLFARHLLVLLCAVVTLVLTGTVTSSAQSTTFESFSVGTVHYQGTGTVVNTGPPGNYNIPSPYGSLWTVSDEWGATGSFDQAVKDDGTGNKVWRMSNAVTTGGFSNQPNSPSSALPAGETTAALYNDRGNDHTAPLSPPNPRSSAASKYFHSGFRFKSATGAAQTGLTLNISPAPRQSNFRMSFVGITDNGSTGFDLNFFETLAGGTFSSSIPIASNLSYTDWHQLDIYMEFVDGLNGDGTGNDIVKIVLNGTLIHTGTTWETYYQSLAPPSPRPIAVDALMFRASGAAQPANSGNGIYFDDVEYDNSPIPPPSIHVYSDLAETMLVADYFTIQAAINNATTVNGYVVRVDAGTYTENVNITKSVYLRGANVGTSGCGTRVAESTIAGGAGTAVTIAANGVTLDGFEITGLTGVSSSGFSNLGIRNNKITADAVGVIAADMTTSSGNTVTIEDNCIDLTTQVLAGTATIGVFLNGATGSEAVLADDNLVTDAFYGYLVYDVNTTPVSTISDGAITGVLQGVAVVNTIGGPLAPSNLAITGMNMSAFSGNYGALPAQNFHAGVYAFTTGALPNTLTLSIEDCTIDGTQAISPSGAGIHLADFSGGASIMQTATINECTLSNNDNRGVDARGVVDATVTNSTFTDNGGAPWGTGGNNGYTIIAQRGATVTATNNFITHPSSSTHSVTAFFNGQTPANTITATDNSVLMNGNAQGLGADNTFSVSSTITATCNWWGVTGASVPPLMAGTVSYELFRTSGADNSGDAGFQPAPNTCNGCGNGNLVTNTNTSEFFCSIQSAIDDAQTLDGHTLTVAAGTYTENINISKALTINGPNAGTSGAGARVAEAILLNCSIDINNTGTTILDGLHILRNDAVAGDQLLLDGNGTNTVQNCLIERNGSAPGTVIRAITTTAGGGTKNILNNKITGDASGGLFGSHVSWNNALYINAGAATVNITGNTIMNCRTSLNVDDNNANVIVSGNTFDNNGTHASFGGTVPTTGSYTWGANEFKNPGSAFFNLSNVATTFRLDISAGTYLGTAFSALPLATLLNIESGMYHRSRSGRNGLVYYVADNLYVRSDLNNNIQTAVDYAAAGDVVNLMDGTYSQTVTVGKSLTLDGQSKAGTILDGTSVAAPASGIILGNNITDVTIRDLTVQKFTGTSGNTHAGIYGTGGNNNLSIDNVALLNNPTASGFYANGPVDNVSVTNSMVENNGSGARGIVIWNGLKTNITFTGNMLFNNSCCGIELQDGDASAVNISNNTIDISTGDNAIGVTGLNASTGANTINNNIITGGGRFGIEIKNPAGGVTVNSNNVTLTSQNTDVRDRAGIAILRRAVTGSNVDVPNGVSITGNTVDGYQQSSTSEGFGIVVEGTNHTVTGNTVQNCEVGHHSAAKSFKLLW